MSRRIQRLIKASTTSDGAGVRLKRVLGQSADARADPFLLLDEFGSGNPDDYIGGFPDHPHRGFETVTLMLEGQMRHRDHLGNEGVLGPGSVQWMTAGAGIIHSEMPARIEGRMHGFQIWINLPDREKMRPPRYQEFGASEIPTLQAAPGVSARLIAGCLAPHVPSGPVTDITVAPLLADLSMTGDSKLHIDVSATASTVIYPYAGQVVVGSTPVPAGTAAVLGPGPSLGLGADRNSRLLLLAAEPIGEPVVQHGPFVMTSRAQIEQALTDYRKGTLAWRP